MNYRTPRCRECGEVTFLGDGEGSICSWCHEERKALRHLKEMERIAQVAVLNTTRPRSLGRYYADIHQRYVESY